MLITIFNQGMNQLVATECIPTYLIGKLNWGMFEIFVVQAFNK
jgi:hypothetical protein